MGLKADGFIRLTLPDPPILTLLWLPYLLLSPKTDNYRFDRKSVGERIFHGHIRTQRPRKVLNRPLKHQCQLLVVKNRLFLKTGNFRSLPVIGQGRYPQHATIRRTLPSGSYEKICLFKHTNFAKFGGPFLLGPMKKICMFKHKNFGKFGVLINFLNFAQFTKNVTSQF